MKIRTEVSGSAYVFWALLCLVLPLDWLISAIFAAAIHELFHIMVVLLSGGTVRKVQIHSYGAVIDASCTGTWKELFCILAGPVGSFSLLLLGSMMPEIAFCAMVQGIFNLLPVYPLDGGRAVLCICRRFFTPGTGRKICFFLGFVSVVIVFAFGLMTAVAGMGFGPLMFATVLMIKVLSGKISCKEGDNAVQ